MVISKAVITVAGRNQRTLPLQSLIDRDGEEKAVLRILVEEALRAGIEDIGLVVCPGDEEAYRAVAGDHAGRLTFVPQPEPRGYAQALFCARPFLGEAPFLHLVGDHLYVSRGAQGCAQQIVEFASQAESSVSAVQSTREGQLRYFGTIGGRRLGEGSGPAGQYRIEQVVEKPTPTEAEQELLIPGLRAGHYLCLFGVHVFGPSLFVLLEQALAEGQGSAILSEVLTALARQEQYLALEAHGWRYDLGVRYGLLNAQLALALSGSDREQVLNQLLELLALRQLRPEANQA